MDEPFRIDKLRKSAQQTSVLLILNVQLESKFKIIQCVTGKFLAQENIYKKNKLSKYSTANYVRRRSG
jgi:hypothetical protein